MLTVDEIKQFIDEDAASQKKKFAKKGQNYYDGDHDIKGYRLFYYNADGILVEDKFRSNIKIPHPFFTELCDQATQHVLSGEESFIKSDIPELQTELDAYFNENEDFISELSEVITGTQAKGFDYMYSYKDADGKTAFQWADSIGVVEVEKRFASDKKDHVLYRYVDRIDKDGKTIKKIIDFDDEQRTFYIQTDDGAIILDKDMDINPKPHVLYQEEGDEKIYYDSLGYVPFFRMDNNKKQKSYLSTVKDLIDDYDLMASSLSNNLVDFDTPMHVVKGYQGDNLDELQTNLKSKKIAAVDAEGGIDIKTVDVPFEARVKKLELDEKNIYRFGFGLNMSGLKDTSATTNLGIQAAYALLNMKCRKIVIRLKQFLRKLIKIVLQEINELNGTDYQMKDVYFNFKPETMSNAQEDAAVKLTEAQARQADINTLLSLATKFDNETLMQMICEVLDIDYDDIKDKLPDPDEAANAVQTAQKTLDGVTTTEPGGEGGTGEGDVLNE